MENPNDLPSRFLCFAKAHVDQYLANLKAEIMKHISDNTDLIVS